MPAGIDLVGSRFGRWLVLEMAARRTYPNSGATRRMFRCRCDCGTEKVVDTQTLRDGDSQSCGCLLRELNAEALLKRCAAVASWGTCALAEAWSYPA